MATVFELSEPYRNYLVAVLPRGRGVCAMCWTAVDPAYSLCYQCYIARGEYGRRRLADVVVPIALAVKREQLAHELWHYKYDPDATVRRRLETRLAAVLWRFLGQHESHVAEAVDVAGFDIVTTVPGTRKRDDEHPLVRIVGTLVGQTRDRYESLLELGPSGADESRAVLLDRYRPTRTLSDRPSVLLIDDTWTTGGRAQSAVLALREAGAATIAVAVIGRHFDRAFGPGEAYYQQARRRKFTWEQCCLEYHTDDTPRQLYGRAARWLRRLRGQSGHGSQKVTADHVQRVAITIPSSTSNPASNPPNRFLRPRTDHLKPRQAPSTRTVQHCSNPGTRKRSIGQRSPGH
jgi:hypothetical protein